MSIRVTALNVDIPYVRPYGWAPRPKRAGSTDLTVQGHEFDVRVELKFSKYTKFAIGEHLDFDLTALAWNGTIRWYAPDPYPRIDADWETYTDGMGFQPGLNWKFAKEDVINFASAERRGATKTVKIGWFGGGSGEPGWWDPWYIRHWRDLAESLVPGPPGIDAYKIEQAELKGTSGKKRLKAQENWKIKAQIAAGKYFLGRNETLKTIMTDRPGLTKKSETDEGLYAQTGGGGMYTLARHTRRRVVHFNCGLQKVGKMTTATQILETVGGHPTINKFIVPGCTMQETEDPALLARWRTQLDRANIDNFSLSK